MEYNKKTHIKTKVGWLSRSDKCDWENIYSLYLKTYSLVDVGNYLGLTNVTVKNYFNKFGFTLYSRSEISKNTSYKAKETNLKKYGVENPNLLKDIQNKIVETNLKRYGVRNPNQLKSVRDKTRETCLKKYGVDHNFKDKDILNKRKKTYLNNYGVDNPSKSTLIKKKKIQTCLLNHGVVNPFCIEKNRKKAKDYHENNFKVKMNNLPYELLDVFEGNYTRKDGVYTGWKKYRFIHNDCGKEFVDSFNGLPRCPICFPHKISIKEDIFYKYLKNVYKDIECRNRRVISPCELDLYLPDINIAFEYNGSYWHSTVHERISRNYHKDKTEKCLEKGIKLYHIWEHDNEDIVKSLVKSKLRKVDKNYYARNLYLKEVKVKERREFFNINHLHGDVNAKFALGLYTKEGKLVQCISFRKHKEGIEIARLASKLNIAVVGGFSKLLKYSIIKIKDLNINKIITYCDRDWTPDYKDSVYFKNGFTFVKDSGPQLKYFNHKLNAVENREKYQKHKLKKLFPDTYSDDLTAEEILKVKRVYPIYNSGNWKFELEIRREI